MCKYLAGSGRKTGKEPELDRRENDAATRARDGVFAGRKNKVADTANVVAGGHAVYASQHGFDAGDELAVAEWLDEIVIDSCSERRGDGGLAVQR
jgi:hypothetical protein